MERRGGRKARRDRADERLLRALPDCGFGKVYREQDDGSARVSSPTVSPTLVEALEFAVNPAIDCVEYLPFNSN